MRHIGATSLLLSALTLVGTQVNAADPPDWENPAVFARNQLPTHALTIPHPDETGALRGRGEASPFFRTLNGRWSFLWVEKPSDVPDGFFEPGFEARDWDEIDVPSNWQMAGFGHPLFRNVAQPFRAEPPRVPRDYNPVGCYRRVFSIPDSWSGRRIFLHFAGVQSALRVWVNGKEVGYDEGGMEPSEYDITSFTKPGENHIAAWVLRFSDSTYLECQDMWRLSGIFRDVFLFSTPSVHLFDYFVQTAIEPGEAQLQVEATLRNFSERPQPGGTVSVRLLDREGNPVFDRALEASFGEMAPGISLQLQFRNKVPNPRLWSAEQPNLYRLLFKLETVGEEPTPEFVSGRIGFREVEIRDQAILINGVPVKFNGVNRHEHDPVTGRFVSPERMEQDLRLMKQFNINLVRTSHYPPDPRFLDLADEYGIYVVDEVNDEAHANPELSEDPAWLDLFLDRMERMVLRDRNHPGVIFWSAGNESGTGENLAKLIRRGHELDPTRPGWMYGATSLTPDQPFEDIVGPRYPHPEVLEKFALEEDPRPSFMDEYAAATGNSVGNLDEFWSLIRRHRRLTGGAIWDWVSPGILEPVRMTGDRSPLRQSAAVFGRASLVSGKYGLAIALSGQDEWVETYRHPSLDLDGEQLTLSLWVHPRAWNGTNSLLTKGNQFGLEQTGRDRLEFYIQDGEKVSIERPVPADWEHNWHRVTASYDGLELSLWVDREPPVRRRHAGRIHQLPWPVAVGKNAQTQGQDHPGPISNAIFDQVRIWSRALTPEDLETAEQDGNLVLSLDFEEITRQGQYYSLGIGGRSYGLVWPDRRVQPELWQVKKVGEPVRVTPVDLKKGLLLVENRHCFINLELFNVEWSVTAPGRTLQQGRMRLATPPLQSEEIRVPFDAPPLDGPGELWLNLSFRLAGPRPWADSGHELAWAQFPLSDQPIPPPAAREGSLEVRSDGSLIEVLGKDFQWTFSRQSGRIESLIYKGRRLISNGPQVNVWRAPTANELDEWRNPPIAALWYREGLDRSLWVPTSVLERTSPGGEPELLSGGELRLPGGETLFESETLYRFHADGRLWVQQSLRPRKKLPEWLPGIPAWLPRIGHQMQVSPALHRFTWYGRGPFETYPDRKTGARVDVFSTEVKDLFEPYLIPQEHGNRTEVRWGTLAGEDGLGLRVAADGWVDMSILRHSQENLSRANYSFQLWESEAISWNIDHCVTGVGETPVPTLEPYRTHIKDYAWSFYIQPFDSRAAAVPVLFPGAARSPSMEESRYE